MASSATAQRSRDPLDCVQGEILFAAGPTAPFGEFAPVSVTIRNARPMLNEFSLDREGFTLVPQKMACLSEPDPDIMRDQYWVEMASFLKEYFKTPWVEPMFPGPLVYRRSRLPITRDFDGTDVPGVHATAGAAHVDFSEIAGPMLAARENQVRGIPIRSYSRLMIINTWRPTSPPPQDFPLAICDNTSVTEEDLVYGLFTDKRIGVSWKNSLACYNERQRWWYFPNMTPDELILFKGYDSENVFRMAHAAFDNRAASPEAGIRESIEARFFVYYE